MSGSNNHEENVCSNDISSGKYFSVGNYLSRPDFRNLGKIANLPLPTIEFHNGCRAMFANTDYYVKLDNQIDIFQPDLLKIVIVLYLQNAEHNFMVDDFDRVNLFLSACYNNGIHNLKFNSHSTTHPGGSTWEDVEISKSSATVTFRATFVIDPLEQVTGGDETKAEDPLYLGCVNAFRYQICLDNGIRVKRKSCSYKLLKDCTEYSYSGNAYLSLYNGVDPAILR